VKAAICALALLAAAACGGAPGAARGPARRPAGTGANVLLVTIDTLRADHLGAYGYARNTSPAIDAFARRGTVFEQAYTFWPKTRGSFVMMFTGKPPSQNGYAKTHPMLLDFNPTIASVLKDAGYDTAAAVDNPNVAAQHGYAKGFDSYRETWQEQGLATETDRAAAITAQAVRFIAGARADRPFFLWIHYVNPHAPYTPPPPFDAAFLDAASSQGPVLPVVSGFHGGVPQQWAVPGKDRSGFYVAQYDGEIAAADREVGRVLDALRASPAADRTLVVLTSDHGESLGEHDYYFDHGEDLFDPSLRIPLIVVQPGAPAGRRSAELASTLDVFPTILDALKVSYPPDLAGTSLLPIVEGRAGPERSHLFAQNERHLTAVLDARFKLVETPSEDRVRRALYDRKADPGENRDVGREQAVELRARGDQLDRFREEAERATEATRRRIGQAPGPARMTAEACEKLKALGYVGVAGCEGE
jgi:arylsulfatase A-like enzyme